MPQDDIAAQWKSFDEAKRTRLLQKMTPEQKKTLRGMLEAKPTTPATTPGDLKRKISTENLTSGYDPGAQEFADKHPVAGPAVRFLSAAGGAAMAVPGQIVHAFTDPLTPEETEEFKGHTRIPGEVMVERLTGAPLVRGVEQYIDPKTRPSLGQAVSVLPEALGSGVGTVAGSEVVGKGLSEVGKLRKAAAERFAPSVQRTARKVTGVEPAVKEAVTKTAEKHGEALADTEEQKVAAKERAAQAKTVDEHSVKVKKAVEGVERKAYEEGNQKFDAVREKIPADAAVPADALVGVVKNAETETLQNIPENIKEFRSILRSEVDETIQRTAERHGFENVGPEPMTWQKLQSLKSRLDARLRSRSPMNGDLKRALFQTRDAVVDEMGKLADSHGAKGEWQAARDFWRQYKEDFTDSKSPLTHTLDAENPAKMRRPLVGDAQSTLGNQGAEILRRYPQHGGTEAATAVEGLVKGNKELRFMGPEKNPNPPAPKAPTLDVSKVAKDAIATRAKNWGSFNARDIGILTSSVLAEPLIKILGGNLGQGASSLLPVAAVAYEGGKYAASRALNSPKIVEWLSRTPPEEAAVIAKIPGADKVKIMDGLTQIAVQSGKSVNLSPAARTLLGPANVAKILAVSAAAGPKTPGDARERMKSLAPKSDVTVPYVPPNKVKGMRTPGNISLGGRPILHNQDGSISSERSFSIGTDKGEVLIPRIFDGKDHTEKEAIEHYRQTGQHLGIFESPESADAYAEQVHNRRVSNSPNQP